MRTWLIVWASLIALTGCGDRDAANRAAAREDLVAAIELARQSQQGFVPASDAGPGIDWPTFRLDRINHTIDALREVDAETALTNPERALVQRWLAQLQAARSRAMLQSASSQWARLTDLSSQALDTLAAIERAHGRAVTADLGVASPQQQEQTPAAPAVDAIQRQMEDLRLAIRQEERRTAELRSQVEASDGELTTLSSQRDEAVREAADHRNEAFVEEGARQYELGVAAAEADRRAMQVERQMQLQMRDRDFVAIDLRLAESRLNTATSSLQSLEAQQSRTQEHRRNVTAVYDAAVAERSQHLSHLLATQLAEMHRLFGLTVEALQSAIANAESAVASAGAAVRTDAAARRQAQFDLLSAQVALVHAQSQAVQLAGAYGQTLDLIAAVVGRTAPERAGQVVSARSDVAQQQAATLTALREIHAQAIELVEELTGFGEEAQATALTHRGYLDAFLERAEGSALSSAGDAGPAAAPRQ